MTIPALASLLRIYVNASDRHQGERVYEAIVSLARSEGMAGASIFAVEASYGAHHRVHDSRSEYDFSDLPVVIEMVDAPERIDEFAGRLSTTFREGLITIEAVKVLRYSH